MDIVDQQWGRLLNSFNQLLLRPDLLESYREAIFRKGFALNIVWRFIDGTTRPCTRHRCDQRLVYSGDKRSLSQLPKYNNSKWNNCKSVWPIERKTF